MEASIATVLSCLAEIPDPRSRHPRRMGSGAVLTKLIERRTGRRQPGQPGAAGVVVSCCLNLRQTSYLSRFGRVGGIELVTKNSYFQENQLNWGEAH